MFTPLWIFIYGSTLSTLAAVSLLLLVVFALQAWTVRIEAVEND
jgi:nitric oxide reductase large subunit